MAVPTVLFNAGTGSDTQASGAGPGTAVYGTAASFSGSVVTLDGSPDLSGVATDGSHLLWLQTDSGRQFFTINAVDDGADTVTTDDAPAGTASGLAWGIGGKRATFDDTSSRLLFSADVKSGWIIQSETDQTVTSALACVVESVDVPITLRGDSESSHRVLLQTANAAVLSAGLSGWRLANLALQNSNGTKTDAYGILFNVAGAGAFAAINCIFGDATNRLRSATYRSTTAQIRMTLLDCEVKETTSWGIQTPGGATAGLRLFNTWVHDAQADGAIYMRYASAASPLVIVDSLIEDNAGMGVWVPSGLYTDEPLHIARNVIHNNSGDGIRFSTTKAINLSTIMSNQITKNGGYGINYLGSDGDVAKLLLDYNNYGTGATANASGAVYGFTQGAHSMNVDPAYTDAAGADYSIGTACKAAGYPDANRTIGANQSATTSFVDIGAAQREEAGGGGGGVRNPLHGMI